MSYLHVDSWPWKIALILGLVALREFVRTTSGTAARLKASSPRRPMSPPTGAPEPGESTKWIIETIDSVAIAIGLVLFVIQPFLIQAFYIPSGSMEDTLRINDRLLVSKLLYRLRDPQFQDVVVFEAPPLAVESSSDLPANEENDFIKRCIGTPGDIVYVTDGRVYRKAKDQATFTRLNEPYVTWSASAKLKTYDMKIINGHVYSREYSSRNIPDAWMCETEPVPEPEQQDVLNAVPSAVPPGKYLVFGDHRNDSNDSHAWGFVPRANMKGKAICVFWPPARLGTIDNMSFHPRPALSPDSHPAPVE